MGYTTVWTELCISVSCDDQSTVLFAPQACCRVLRVCALFERLTEFCFVFQFIFCATLLDFNRDGYMFATTAQMYEEF